ncbi:MAG TPA: hypothetical protein GXZ20_01755 [Halanaerobiaceae bacterium]|mgnify:CR=1 FL=1|jgi:hypothetical protein|nr:hypothetical protein [Halanaerobiaceae bacterium]HOA41407.1 hypothetical protein [Halanaerobiales bacterium]HPZ63527.1 hypothetical protein [Halanaerobiales bacterium]HQD04767.1 hypothetical protein [Halanaerobiales bacterium]
MLQLSTFEDIFNKLHEDYQDQRVQVITKQDGIRISSFQTTIHRIEIKPLNKKESKKWTDQGKKIGLIILKEKYSNNSFSIPFILGYNTMAATFLKDGVVINSLNMEFIIRKIKARKKLLA